MSIIPKTEEKTVKKRTLQAGVKGGEPSVPQRISIPILASKVAKKTRKKTKEGGGG